jgi:sugar-phosphatase
VSTTVIGAAAVLFDMDGTLVDSTALVEEVWTEFSHTHGLNAAQVIAFAHGRPSRDTISTFLPDQEDLARALESFHHVEATRFSAVTAIPGARDVVASLPTGRWAVVTSAIREPAKERLAAVGMPLPTVLIGADDVRAGKPHPEGYARAARELGFAPQDCVVFEDTAAGIEAGLAAGCQAVVVGAARADAMAGLPRIPDFSGVTVEFADGQLVITLPS